MRITLPSSWNFRRAAPPFSAPVVARLGRAGGVAGALALLLAGCAVGPNYRAPQAITPAHWSEPLTGGETNAGLVASAWWKEFHDAELNSLLERAVSSNLDLRMAQARVLEARAHYGAAAAEFLPTVNASGAYDRMKTSQRQPVLGSLPIPSGVPFENNVFQAGFDASWELDVFGGKRRGVEAAKANVESAEYGRRSVLMTLLGDVARNYVEVRGAQRRLELTQENVEAQTKGLAITQNRFAHGLANDLDVQQAAALLATTKAEIPTLNTALQAATHRLGVLLAQPPGALLTELSVPAPIPPAVPQVPVGLPSELILRRPDVRQAERALAAATAQIGVAKADLFPRFFLTGASGFESVSASDWFTRGSSFWSLGPTVQWRVFDAGRIRANVRVENARQEQALAAYEKTVLGAFEDVENGLVSYANEQQRRLSLKDAVAASRQSLELANRLYANGLTDFLRVLEAERSLYQAEDAMAQSDRTVAVNLIALFKSLGGGWENWEVAKQTRE